MDPNIETYFDILNVDNNNQDFKMICYILCGIGGVVLFIGFMGCCGTIRSSKIMLTVVRINGQSSITVCDQLINPSKSGVVSSVWDKDKQYRP